MDVDTFFDHLESHKDEVLALGWLVGVLTVLLTLPPEQQVEVLTSGHFTWFMIATGLGLGAGRAGRGVQKAFENKSVDVKDRSGSDA